MCQKTANPETHHFILYAIRKVLRLLTLAVGGPGKIHPFALRCFQIQGCFSRSITARAKLRQYGTGFTFRVAAGRYRRREAAARKDLRDAQRRYQAFIRDALRRRAELRIAG